MFSLIARKGNIWKKIGDYWKRRSQDCAERSDEAPETNSQDSCDHGMLPADV